MSNTQALADTLDLDQFEDVMVATIVLKNPKTGAPTASSIDIVGPEHPVRKKIQLDRARRLRAEYQRSGKMTVTDPLDDIADETDFLVACTTGWAGLHIGGAPLQFSAEAARSLYTDPKRQWLRTQIKVAIDQADRFIGSSQTI